MYVLPLSFLFPVSTETHRATVFYGVVPRVEPSCLTSAGTYKNWAVTVAKSTHRDTPGERCLGERTVTTTMVRSENYTIYVHK